MVLRGLVSGLPGRAPGAGEDGRMGWGGVRGVAEVGGARDAVWADGRGRGRAVGPVEPLDLLRYVPGGGGGVDGAVVVVQDGGYCASARLAGGAEVGGGRLTAGYRVLGEEVHFWRTWRTVRSGRSPSGEVGVWVRHSGEGERGVFRVRIWAWRKRSLRATIVSPILRAVLGG
jgi:hypothetical protein